MFQSLFGSLLNHLYHYANENVSVKRLSLICITSVLTTIYSLKNCSVYDDLAVNTTLNHSGSFERMSLILRKDKNIIHQLKVRTPQPTASDDTQDLGHSLFQYEPPG